MTKRSRSLEKQSHPTRRQASTTEDQGTLALADLNALLARSLVASTRGLTPPASTVLALQRTIGNQATGRLLIQRKPLANANHMSTQGDWTVTKDGKGRTTKMVATNLKLRGAGLPGPGHNPPTASPPGWTWLNNNNLTLPNGPPYYVRMHLLNGQLGGPGNDADNLAVGSASLNSHHEKNLESEVKNWVQQGGTIAEYTVEVTYNSTSPNLTTKPATDAWQDTIKEITGEFDFIHYKGKKRVRSSSKPFSAEEDNGLDTQANWRGH